MHHLPPVVQQLLFVLAHHEAAQLHRLERIELAPGEDGAKVNEQRRRLAWLRWHTLEGLDRLFGAQRVLWALGCQLCCFLELPRGVQVLELLHDEALGTRQVSASRQRHGQIQVLQLLAHEWNQSIFVHSAQQHLTTPGACARGWMLVSFEHPHSTLAKRNGRPSHEPQDAAGDQLREQLPLGVVDSPVDGSKAAQLCRGGSEEDGVRRDACAVHGRCRFQVVDKQQAQLGDNVNQAILVAARCGRHQAQQQRRVTGWLQELSLDACNRTSPRRT